MSEYCDAEGCVRRAVCTVSMYGKRAKLCSSHAHGVVTALNAIKVYGKKVAT